MIQQPLEVSQLGRACRRRVPHQLRVVEACGALAGDAGERAVDGPLFSPFASSHVNQQSLPCPANEAYHSPKNRKGCPSSSKCVPFRVTNPPLAALEAAGPPAACSNGSMRSFISVYWRQQQPQQLASRSSQCRARVFPTLGLLDAGADLLGQRHVIERLVCVASAPGKRVNLGFRALLGPLQQRQGLQLLTGRLAGRLGLTSSAARGGGSKDQPQNGRRQGPVVPPHAARELRADERLCGCK